MDNQFHFVLILTELRNSFMEIMNQHPSFLSQTMSKLHPRSGLITLEAQLYMRKIQEDL